MRRYGLLGKSLQHSYSQALFAQKFAQEGIEDASYSLFELSDLANWSAWSEAQIRHPEGALKGLNVTVPYKQTILAHLDVLTPEALAIGAVNALRPMEDGKWMGHNTDGIGFAKSIRPFLTSKHDRALILGNGGAAAAVRFVLESLGIEVVHVTRKPDHSVRTIRFDELTPEAVRFFGLIVQATPVGTVPNVSDVLPFPWNGLNDEHLVIDLIYNPTETLFLHRAKTQGATVLNGKDMLFNQAQAAWDWWNQSK
ncbi:MAG: shikimate dehydrogenase [Flavobacteriales bacterium]|nr:shikimate dehydrogenase [Flavobacteriales bacterium]